MNRILNWVKEHVLASLLAAVIGPVLAALLIFLGVLVWRVLTGGFVVEMFGGVTRAQVDVVAQSGTFQIDHQYDIGQLPYYQGEHPCGPPVNGRMFVGGNGTRTAECTVTFDKPFPSTPEVMASLSGFDLGLRSNPHKYSKDDIDSSARIDVDVVGVSRRDFSLLVKTWFRTDLHFVQISWIAVLAEPAE